MSEQADENEENGDDNHSHVDSDVLKKAGVGEHVGEVDRGRQDLQAAREVGQVTRETIGEECVGVFAHLQAVRCPDVRGKIVAHTIRRKCSQLDIYKQQQNDND